VKDFFRPKTVHRNPIKMPKRHTKQNCDPTQNKWMPIHTHHASSVLGRGTHICMHPIQSNRTETEFNRGA
jgi:hypothetical protein